MMGCKLVQNENPDDVHDDLQDETVFASPVVRPSYYAMWKEVLLIVTLVIMITFTVGPLVDLTRELMNLFSRTIPTYVIAAIYNNSTYLSFGLLWLLTSKMLYRRYSRELFFNKDYIELKTGIWATKTVQLKLSNVTAIEADQSLIEKFLGIGTLEVGGASTHEMKITISGIPKPHQVAKSIRDLL